MFKVDINKINKLRKTTGVGIIDCKKSLIESNGDLNKAIQLLRIKGKKIANSRLLYKTCEGILVSKIDKYKKKGVIIGLKCETDFSSKNNYLIKFVDKIAEKALFHKNIKNLLKDSFDNNIIIENKIIEQIGIIKENINLSIFEIIEDDFVSFYTHNNNKIAVLVGFSLPIKKIDKDKIDKDKMNKVGKDIAMQIAAMNPISLDEKNLPLNIINQEKKIIEKQIGKEKKSEDIFNKIVNGKLKKFIKNNTLLNQSFIKDNKLSVKDYLKKFNSEIRINNYKRIVL